MFGRRRAGGRIGRGSSPAEDGDRQAGAHVWRRAGEVRRVVLGYDLAGVGPARAESQISPKCASRHEFRKPRASGSEAGRGLARHTFEAWFA